VRLRPACSLRSHGRHDAARDCTIEREENCFDLRLRSDMALFQQSLKDNGPAQGTPVSESNVLEVAEQFQFLVC